MPELPDINVYIEALEERLLNRRLIDIKLQSPFLLRTVEIPLEKIKIRQILEFRRIGKRIAIGLENDFWMVFHLMIAGRFHWNEPEKKPPGRNAQIILSFENGVLYMTEAGKKKRASLHILQGEDNLALHNPGGKEIDSLDLQGFSNLLTETNHTLKRVLTDPHIFSGIGNAYSDEVLHKAGLSPVKQSQKMAPEEIRALFEACKTVLEEWTERLRVQRAGKFPGKVTAFHPEMAVHGKFGQACPVCKTQVQRITYASNDTNYCPRCQTGGKLLADRDLSRLLKADWPKTIEELENRKLKK